MQLHPVEPHLQPKPLAWFGTACSAAPRSCAAILLLAVLTGISATAVSQTAQISVNREACINSSTATSSETAAAACTRLVDALARGEITGPEGAAVRVARGNLHAVRGEADLAIADYDRAIVLDPSRSVAFFNRAGALAASGEIDRAFADYDRAIELDPADADACVGRGRAHYQKKDYAAAVADYEAALRLVPGDAEALAESGDARERAGLYDRAEDYSRLIAIDPSNAKTWNNRCWDRALLGRLEEAIADCNVALGLAPDDPGTLDSRGFAYLKLGQLEQAIADYDAALVHNPQDPGSLYGRGLARLRGQRDPEGGRADLAAAEALDPGVVAEFARYGFDE